MKEKRKNGKMPYFIALFCFVACLFMLTACGEQYVLSRGFDKDEVFRINRLSCYEKEVLVYFANIKNQYTESFGSEIWSKNIGDISLEENVRETVIARLAKIKMLVLLAEEYEIELTDREKNYAKQAAAAYFGSLTEEEIAALGGIDRDTICSMYEEYALADKVYHHITDGVNPEISDEEARTVVVKQIFLSSTVSGNQELAEQLLSRLRDGENIDFIAGSYSQKDDILLTVRKGEVEEVLENAIFNLAQNELSNVITATDGYYIFYCVSPYDETETELSRQQMIEERKYEVFDQEYNLFASQQNCYLNHELWDNMTFPAEQITTSSFFDVYASFFQ
ncbi:MAG: peptidylprolyl isomerase [Lachnospiraceae bacterium]